MISESIVIALATTSTIVGLFCVGLSIYRVRRTLKESPSDGDLSTLVPPSVTARPVQAEDPGVISF